MILRIIWIDRYQRAAQGKSCGTVGLRDRLAHRFGTSPEVIKKIAGLKHEQYGKRRRKRFPGIALKSIQRHAQNRLRKLQGEDL